MGVNSYTVPVRGRRRVRTVHGIGREYGIKGKRLAQSLLSTCGDMERVWGSEQMNAVNGKGWDRNRQGGTRLGKTGRVSC
jgi:hypothetical protein